MDEKIVKAWSAAVITKVHINKWVALTSDYQKIIAIGESLSELLKKTADKENKVVIKVLPQLGYAPNVFF